MILTETHKSCSKCGEMKLHSEFGVRVKAAAGMMSRCRVCRRDDHRESRSRRKAAFVSVPCLAPDCDFGSVFNRRGLCTKHDYDLTVFGEFRPHTRDYGFKTLPGRILKGERPAWRERLLAVQGGVCAICWTDDPGSLGWDLDHDHSCDRHSEKHHMCDQCVRGALCGSCNRGLGLFNDSQVALFLTFNMLVAFDAGEFWGRNVALVERFGFPRVVVPANVGEVRDAVLVWQGGVCSSCGDDNPYRWALDHDHSCQLHSSSDCCWRCIRTVLCSACNSGLGFFGDSLALFPPAAEYLSVHGIPLFSGWAMELV